MTTPSQSKSALLLLAILGLAFVPGCLLWRSAPPAPVESEPAESVSVESEPLDPFANKTPVEILAIALDGETAVLRESAIWKLPLGTYNAELAQIAQTDAFGRVRAAAVDKCTDAVALADIALHEPESWIKVKAIEKVTDKSVLESLAQSGNGIVRPAAEKRLAALKR